MTTPTAHEPKTVAVIGAAGKMGLRVSANLEKSDFRVLFSENSPKGQDILAELGREVIDSVKAAAEADVVILAVPDRVLGAVSEALVFSGIEAGALDVAFLDADDPAAARLAKVGLGFEIPEREGVESPRPPGSDPDRPPRLR